MTLVMIKYLQLTDNSLSLTLNNVSLSTEGLHTKATLGLDTHKFIPAEKLVAICNLKRHFKIKIVEIKSSNKTGNQAINLPVI